MAKTELQEAVAVAAAVGNNGNGGVPLPELGYLSISPGPGVPLPDVITTELVEIQKTLGGMPLWLVIHAGGEGNPLGKMTSQLCKAFYDARTEMVKGSHIGLVIESGGGSAEAAYAMAKLINNRCTFTAFVPQYAKSAATLLALGAEEIRIGCQAELGPLDVQIYDSNTEERNSALDEIQSLDSLFEFATRQVIETSVYWATVLEKKNQNVFPFATEFVAKMMRPLLDKIDTVHYTSWSRLLRVAEEYAARLLTARYGEQQAVEISRRLVRNYPHHGFNIDFKEAKLIGITNISEIDDDLQARFDRVIGDSDRQLIGRFFTGQSQPK